MEASTILDIVSYRYVRRVAVLCVSLFLLTLVVTSIYEQNKRKNDTVLPLNQVDISAHVASQKTSKTNAQHRGLVNDNVTEDEIRKGIYQTYYRPLENVNLNCKELIVGNHSTINESYYSMEIYPSSRRNVVDKDFSANCSHFRRSRGYIDHHLSVSELNFPLAFGIAVFKDIAQVERLLRAIYRPHNYYCFHVDKKSPPKFHKQMKWLASCFDNVFMTPYSIDVIWGQTSVLNAELLMMNEIIKHKKWKYYINLTGQEFPLKTNRELVAILQAMQGANIVDGTIIRALPVRWKEKKTEPPHNITLVKGSVHIGVNRHFVDFCIHDKRAEDFLIWLNNTDVADETFFASINHNTHLNISGSYLGDAEEYPLKPFIMRYKNWHLLDTTQWSRPCTGIYVRSICILGTGDIYRAYGSVGFFANKLYLDYQYMALDCLEEVLYEKTWQQYLHDDDIDVQYYTHLDYVKYKL